MKFLETRLRGAFVVESEIVADERGFFARVFSADQFSARGLVSDFVQHGVSYNRSSGTLRGLHFQREPHGETKLVRCTHGALRDVIVDLRRSSETFKHWLAVDLSQANGKMLYVPEGFAHGFQTLEAHTQVHYLISTYYDPDSADGVRWDDPALGIAWPVVPPTVISERDRALPLLEAA